VYDHRLAEHRGIDVRADARHLAGDVEAAGVRQPEAGHLREAGAQEDIHAVESGGPDAHHRLARSGHGIRDILITEDFDPAGLMEAHCFHRIAPTA